MAKLRQHEGDVESSNSKSKNYFSHGDYNNRHKYKNNKNDWRQFKIKYYQGNDHQRSNNSNHLNDNNNETNNYYKLSFWRRNQQSYNDHDEKKERK